jgi:cobalt-zinc-cadmium efflux system outer membrane protein
MFGHLFVCGTAALCALAPVSAGAQAPARSAQPQAPLTIDAAVREAMDHNLTLLAERFNVTVAEASLVTASLRPNPVFTANLMVPQRALVDAGITPTEQVVRTDVVFERGGKRERRMDTARLAQSVAELQVLNTTRALILDVAGAFTDVQLAELNLALARENLTALDDIVRVNRDRVRTGDLAAVELSRSQLEALQFQNDVRQRETKLRVARNHLSTLLGRGPNGEALTVIGDLRRDPEPIGYEDLFRQALARRPDVRALRTDQARSVSELRLQLANGRVDYTVSGEYHRQEGTTISGNTLGVFFSAPLPLFNRNQGEIARARIQTQQAETRVHAVEMDVSREAANAFAEYSTAREVLATIERQMLAQAREVRSTTEYAYRRGEASLIEFLDAVRAFNQTMEGYNEARAQYARSLYTLDSIRGKVTP